MEFSTGQIRLQSMWTKRNLSGFTHVFKKEYLISDARLIHKCSFHSLVLISSGLPQWRLNIFLCVSEQLQDALAARVIYQSHIEGTNIKS